LKRKTEKAKDERENNCSFSFNKTHAQILQDRKDYPDIVTIFTNIYKNYGRDI
jgi:hypothetical protein